MGDTNFKIIDDEVEKWDESKSTKGGFWKILVVDDEEEVHLATKFALKNVLIENQTLNLIHCYSAAEALEALKLHEHIAVALIDVVMEAHDAGLKLVEEIRRNDKYANMRIIIRTGQPGYAPELSVITQFDINAYVNKSELNRTRLISTLIATIRSFHQLEIIHRSRQGLEIVVGSTVDLYNRSNLRLFAYGILTQLKGLLGENTHGFVSLFTPSLETNENNCVDQIDSLPLYKVLVATPPYERYVDKAIKSAAIENIRNTFVAAINCEPVNSTQKELGLHFISRHGRKIKGWHWLTLPPPITHLCVLFG